MVRVYVKFILNLVDSISSSLYSSLFILHGTIKQGVNGNISLCLFDVNENVFHHKTFFFPLQYLHILPLFVYSTNSSYLHSIFFLALFIKVCMHDICRMKKKKTQKSTHTWMYLYTWNKNVKNRESGKKARKTQQYFQCTFTVWNC